jgi:hypothetical protein
VNSLFRSPGLAVRRCLWVAVSSAFFVKLTEPAVGFVKQGWLGLPRASLYDGGCRWRVKTQDLGSLGRVPGRWVIVDGFIPSFEAGVSTPLKAVGRWGFSRPWLCSSSSATAVVGVGDAELRRQAQALGA